MPPKKQKPLTAPPNMGQVALAKVEGNRLYSKGKLTQAIAAYTKGIELVERDEGTPEDKGCLHLLYSNRSRVNLECCQVDEAMQDAECAIDENPEFAKAYVRRADVLLEIFKFKEALADLDTANELEPELDLSEQRARAEGKKWEPNCFLKRQLRLRSKYKCDYVLWSIEIEGVVQPHDPIFLQVFSSFTKELKGRFHRAFDKVVETGKVETRGRPFTCVLGSEGRIQGMVMKPPTRREDARHDPNQPEGDCECCNYERDHEGLEKYRLLVQEQMRKELGPDFELVTAVATNEGAISESAKRRCESFLWTNNCMAGANFKQLIEDDTAQLPAQFYPGPPRWFESEEMMEKFQAARKFEGLASPNDYPIEDAASCMRHFRTKREPLMRARCPRIRTTPGACRGCGCAEDIKDHKNPMECICGTQFCSHVCARSGCHRDDCKMWSPFSQVPYDDAALKAGYLYTKQYWDLVMWGHFPFEYEPEFVALWQERGLTVESVGSSATLFEMEKNFHYENEVKDHEMWQAATRLIKDADDFSAAGQEAVMRTFERISHPLPGDSCARIQAKVEVCDELLNSIMADAMRAKRGDDAGITDRVIQQQAIPRFLNFVEIYRKDDPQAETLIKWLKHRQQTSGRV